MLRKVLNTIVYTALCLSTVTVAKQSIAEDVDIKTEGFSTSEGRGISPEGKQLMFLHFYEFEPIVGEDPVTVDRSDQSSDDIDIESDISGGGQTEEPFIASESAASAANAGAILDPVVSGLTNSINSVLGGNKGQSAIASINARAFAYKKFVDNVPTQLADLDNKVAESFRNRIFTTDAKNQKQQENIDKLKSTMSDCFRINPLTNLEASYPPPRDTYKASVSKNLSSVVETYTNAHIIWNGQGKITGMIDVYPGGGPPFSFDENAFINRYTDIAVNSESSTFLSDARHLLDTTSTIENAANSIDDCLNREYLKLNEHGQSDREPIFSVEKYQFQNNDNELGNELDSIYKRLKDLPANSTATVSAKNIGMRAAVEGDLSLSAGNTSEAEIFRDIALEMLDIVTGFLPGVSWGRDIYEAVTGVNLITNQPLSDGERIGSIIGAVSVGMGSSLTRATRVLSKIVDTNDPAVRKVIRYLGDKGLEYIEYARNLKTKVVHWNSHSTKAALFRGDMAQSTAERIITVGKPYFDRKPDNLSVVFWADRQRVLGKAAPKGSMGIAISPRDNAIKTVLPPNNKKIVDRTKQVLPGTNSSPRYIRLPIGKRK